MSGMAAGLRWRFPWCFSAQRTPVNSFRWRPVFGSFKLDGLSLTNDLR